MITTERLKEIEELANAATDGPWEAPFTSNDEFGRGCVFFRKEPVGGFEIHRKCNPANNAAFIAASRTLVPELVTEIHRLREVLEWYGHHLQWYGHHLDLGAHTVELDKGQRARDAIGGV